MGGAACLVAGGGRVAARKALTLAEHGAHVTVVSPELSERLDAAVRAGKVAWLCDEYRPEHTLGKVLVVAATSDPALNVAIGRDAASNGALFCIVSPGRCSQVLFPALHRTRGVTVAVHSDGADCAESRRVRDAVAGLLAAEEEPPGELAVFGARRDALPADTFDRLRAVSAERLRGQGVSATLAVLSTCARWECCFTSPHPARTARAIRGALHEICDVFPEAHRTAFELTTGVRARHHLTRVAVGLDSPLPGETDIVGQLRRAADGMSGDGVGDLADALAGALRVQKRIRQDSGLQGTAPAWPGAIAAVAAREARRRGAAGVVLWGCGRLSRAVARLLLEEGLTVAAVSRRAGELRDSWAGDPGIAVDEPGQLGRAIAGAGAVVLSSALPPRATAAVLGTAASGRLAVIDLEGGAAEAFVSLGEDYVPLAAVGSGALSAAHAAAIAAAEVRVTAEVLRHADAGATKAPERLVVGTRGSRLAMAQIEELRAHLDALAPQVDLRVVTLSSPGDRDKTTALPSVTEGDFFTRDLDEALRRGTIDLAVHSAKDLPEAPVAGLRLAAVTPSPAPWDCLVTQDRRTLPDLPSGARIGTSSRRRAEGLRRLRPDLLPADIRGNVPERLAQLDAGDYDGLLLAAVGLLRLGMGERIAQVFSASELAPAPGQGQLALVIREDDEMLRRFLSPLDLGDRGWLAWP